MSDGVREWLEEAPDGILGAPVLMLFGGVVLIVVGLRKLRTADRQPSITLLGVGVGAVVVAAVRLLIGW